jgi:hypothetical protein
MRKSRLAVGGNSPSRPSIRNKVLLGTDGKPVPLRQPVYARDPSLGPWVYYWPIYFGSYGKGNYFDGEPIYSEADQMPLPKEWIGKILIRRGQKPSEIINYGKITPEQANKYVFEDKIPDPYVIVGPNQSTGDYIANRLCVYVDSNGVIDNVAYG